MTVVSNIDDLLSASVAPSTPPTSESEPYEAPIEAPNDDYDYPDDAPESASELGDAIDSDDDEPESKKEEEHDDYGNIKSPPKTYSEEEVNERINKAIRERLARGNNQNQQAQQAQTAPQGQGFEYDPNDSESWEVQLEQFVEKTVSRMGQKQAQQMQHQRDMEAQSAFEDKFSQGMGRFSDFREVVGQQPITDPMTYGLRGLPDPAAFIYAASKRHPQELARISQIQDPAAQIMEMGRLEERMKKGAKGTTAPKPVSRSRDDGSMPAQGKKKELTIDDLIAKADAKRQSQLNAKRRGR